MQLVNHNTVHSLHSGGPHFIQPIKDKTALSDSSIRWGGLRFGSNVLVMLVLILLMLPVVGSAETEVEGEVSGVWDVEGSPYIVVDSTWVPEEESLILREGVIVIFEENQGLYVYGSLDATGNEEDSVYIRVNENVEHWRGLRFYGRNQTEWNYASIVCPDSALVLDPNCTLLMENCLVDADRTIAGDTYYGARSCNMTFSHSIIQSRSHHTATGGRLTANHTQFDFGEDETNEPGFWSPGTSFRLTSCEIIGALHAEEGVVYADSCRFLRTPIGRRTGLGLGLGRMTESYVEGGVGAGQMYSETLVTFRNNTLLGSLGLTGTVNVSGCNVGALLNISEGESITVRNSIFNESLFIRFSNSVTIDSCYFVPIDTNRHFTSMNDVSRLSITRCVIHLCRINVSRVDEELFDHNTIVFDSSGHYAISANPSSFTNNIIMTVTPGDQLFTSWEYELPGFEYNCVWGFDSYAGPPDSAVTELDSTNIIANPLIEWDGIIPNISSNSPCRDAGDPEFDLDPDSTRTDIGMRYFDQRQYIPGFEVHLPGSQQLTGVYPNPFNEICNVRYSLPATSDVCIGVFDSRGREVYMSYQPNRTPGKYVTVINVRDWATGLYFLEINNGTKSKMFKITLIK